MPPIHTYKMHPLSPFTLTSLCAIAFLTLVTLCHSVPHTHNQSDTQDATNLLGHQPLIFRNTIVVYGKGRRSERELPECSPNEACNLSHHRLWFPPITERFCRCLRRQECPLTFVGGNPPDAQHVTNRGQLKFCNPNSLPTDCSLNQTSLIINRSVGPVKDNSRPAPVNHRWTLKCRCRWPRGFEDENVRKDEERYRCIELPKCNITSPCGLIRPDTYEVYYTCTCPVNHLCVASTSYRDQTVGNSLSTPLRGTRRTEILEHKQRVDVLAYKGMVINAFCKKRGG